MMAEGWSSPSWLGRYIIAVDSYSRSGEVSRQPGLLLELAKRWHVAEVSTVHREEYVGLNWE